MGFCRTVCNMGVRIGKEGRMGTIALCASFGLQRCEWVSTLEFRERSNLVSKLLSIRRLLWQVDEFGVDRVYLTISVITYKSDLFVVSVDLEADISQLEAPTFTTLNRGPPEPMLRLNWDHRVNLVAEKVLNPMIHCCDQCGKPILIYGRMVCINQ